MLCIHGFSAAPTNSPGGVKRVQKKPSLLTLELSREPTQQAYSEGSEDEDDCYSDDDFYSDEDEDDLYDLPASPSGTPCSAPIVIPSPRTREMMMWQLARNHIAEQVRKAAIAWAVGACHVGPRAHQQHHGALQQQA